MASGLRRLPHEMILVALTREETALVLDRLEREIKEAVVVLARTVAGSLRARHLEGEVRHLRSVLAVAEADTTEYSGDQLRTLLNLFHTGYRMDGERALYTRLQGFWNGTEVLS